MKNTYLVKQGNCLIEVSGSEWIEIIKQNRRQPVENRRFFIADCIEDGKEIDRMFIEVSCEEHRKWNREHTAAERNRAASKNAIQLSLEDFVPGSKDISLSECVADPCNLEENIISEIKMNELQEALRIWKPWALDCFHAYMSGEKCRCVAIIAEKYGVSKQTARSYKRKFEEFVKNFLI